MRKIRTTVACLALVIGLPTSSAGQELEQLTPPPIPSHAIPIGTGNLAPGLDASEPDALARTRDLARWIDDFTKWTEWSRKFANGRRRKTFTGFRDRPEKPMPPPWLHARCDKGLDDSEPLATACTLLEEWRIGFALEVVSSAAAVPTAPREDSGKTRWWEHVHADMLWTAMQSQARVYGVIGMHTAITVHRRFQVFAAPGAMLLTVPARNGTRDWKIAASYGFGYRLLDFAFPGHRPAVLHLNVARAWLLSDVSNVVAGRTADLAGFSVTFKKLR